MLDRPVCASLSAFLLPLVFTAGPAVAQQDPAASFAKGGVACHAPAARTPIAGDAIGLVPDSSIDPEVIDEAIALWGSCPNSRGDFPALVHGESTMTVYVSLEKGTSGSKRCGGFRGRRIRLFRWARTSSRAVRSCGSLAQNLAHELGHVLGLAHVRDTPACDAQIMAELEPGNLFSRTVTAEECRLVGERWHTLAEMAGEIDGGRSPGLPPPRIGEEASFPAERRPVPRPRR